MNLNSNPLKGTSKLDEVLHYFPKSKSNDFVVQQNENNNLFAILLECPKKRRPRVFSVENFRALTHSVGVFPRKDGF